MGDQEIVSLLAAGDPQGLEQAYTAYADRIHDYARRMLRSDDAAADVTHDTFLIALAKADGLRDAAKLRPWLYAIARNECLRVLRATARTTNLDPEIELAAEGSPDMSAGLTDSDLRELVHAAAAGLSPKDREVFDLGMRHNLSAAEIAAALGVSDNSAHAMLSRVRTQFERTLGAFLVARSGRSECAELSELLEPWDGEFDALWRKRIARHVASCSTCSQVERRELSPSALLGLMPLFLAPSAVRERLFSPDLDLVSASRRLAERAGPFELDGFPGTPSPQRRRLGAFAMLAALLLLLGGVGLLRVLVLDDPSEGVEGTPSAAHLEPAGQEDGSFDSTVPPGRPPVVGVTVVLEPAPTAAVPEVTAGPTTTAAAPTVAPATPAAAPTTPAPTAPATTPPAAGHLVVPDGARVTRDASSGQGSGTFTVSAMGGPVDWSATTGAAGVTLTPNHGHLANLAEVTITITVGPTTPTSFVITFDDGQQVTVTAL